MTGGTLFEELGFYYVGPVDAHDLENLVPILENIRDNVPNTKPVLLHVKSVKGKGDYYNMSNCSGITLLLRHRRYNRHNLLVHLALINT